MSSAAALLGWLLDVPGLKGLGFERYPIWPLTAFGYLLLSLGFAAAIQGYRRLPHLLWAIPLAIAVTASFETIAGADLGIDALLFPDSLAAYPSAHPGRPGVGPSVTLALLALTGFATRQTRWFRDEIGSLLASAVLAIGAAATVMLLITTGDIDAPRPISSLPGAVAAIALAAAFIVWQADFRWVRLTASLGSDWWTVRRLLPLVLLLPLFPSLLGLLIVPAGSRIPAGSQIAIVIGNILILALVAYGALVRLARGQAATIELAQALDSVIVVLTAPDGTILSWSSGCERLYGWSAAEAVGRNKYALLHARCEELGTPRTPRRADSESQALVEIRRDGTEVAVLERAHRVEIPGRAPLLVLSMTDVSQTATAIAALEASEDRLAEAAAAQELGIFEWDVPSGRIQWSPGTEQRLGIVPGTITDFESWRAQVYPEDIEGILDTLAQTVADRADKFRFRYRFLQPNGGVRAVEGSARAYYDDDGNLVRTVGVMTDVSEREEREAQLVAREAQLRSILRAVPDAMVVIDAYGKIREFSTAAEALWGYRAADVIGSPVTMLAPDDDRRRYTSAIQHFLDSGDGSFMGRVVTGTGERADGSTFPVEFHTGLARTESQILFTIFFRDLSERLATEERMSELSGELAHVSRQSAMSELAADIAHELNQPLAAIANFLAAARMLIDKGEQPERVLELLRMGNEQTLRAGQIIRRMRDFMARHEVEMRVEPLEQTVRDAAELVLVGTGQFHIRVSYDLDPDAPLIFADRVQVQQVLVNLLRNSMQALRTLPSGNREIIIASRKIEGNMVEITVSDTGTGIPETIVNELFTRFTTTKGSKGGMGIGLSISKRIIEAHGGTLSASNRAEGGASFSFTLPTVGEGEEE